MLTASCGANIDHGVLAVEYGTDAGSHYWKVKNSWCEGGYVGLLRGEGGAGQWAASFLQLRIQLSVTASPWDDFKGCAMNAKEALDDQQMRAYFSGEGSEHQACME